MTVSPEVMVIEEAKTGVGSERVGMDLLTLKSVIWGRTCALVFIKNKNKKINSKETMAIVVFFNIKNK